jgi:hypothetical protein
MKRMLVAGSIAALALIVPVGAASAAPADAACFGQVHKRINTGDLGVALGLDNVGQLVSSVGGPVKNATATSVCGG